MYRRTKKYSAQRLEAMRRGRERAAAARPAPAYPDPLPLVRMRITVERFDPAAAGTHVFELRRCNRVDQFAVYVDGEPWQVCGLSRVLEGVRKASPRLMSSRALYD